jgi:hypothetical protein
MSVVAAANRVAVAALVWNCVTALISQFLLGCQWYNSIDELTSVLGIGMRSLFVKEVDTSSRTILGLLDINERPESHALYLGRTTRSIYLRHAAQLPGFVVLI